MATLRARARDRLERGLAWIVAHRDAFRPTDAFDAPQLKALAELSILYGSLDEWMIPPSRHLAVLLATVQDVLGKPALSEWVRKLPSAYSPYVIAYLPLRARGHRMAGFEDAIARLRTRGYPAALETVPYRELELHHMMWKAGLGDEPRCDGVYRGTALARCPNPVYYSLDEV